MEEFDKIMNQQQKHYSDIITDEFKSKLKNEIIYYQRRLKSQKGLVSICEMEKITRQTENGKTFFVGPRVAHKSSPLFQVCKIWETINNITLINKKGEIYAIPIDKKREIFEYLDNNNKLTQTELFKILELKKEDGWLGNKMLTRGIQGNILKSEILKTVSGLEFDHELLKFDLIIEQFPETITFLKDRKTGEVLDEQIKKSDITCN